MPCKTLGTGLYILYYVISILSLSNERSLAKRTIYGAQAPRSHPEPVEEPALSLSRHSGEVSWPTPESASIDPGVASLPRMTSVSFWLVQNLPRHSSLPLAVRQAHYKFCRRVRDDMLIITIRNIIEPVKCCFSISKSIY